MSESEKTDIIADVDELLRLANNIDAAKRADVRAEHRSATTRDDVFRTYITALLDFADASSRVRSLCEALKADRVDAIRWRTVRPLLQLVSVGSDGGAFYVTSDIIEERPSEFSADGMADHLTACGGAER